MVRKTSGKSRTGIYLAIIVVLVGLISYSIIKPFLNWKTYTIDNFITFSYPSDWHFQNDNFLTLSGNEQLFLISDYNGLLSRQDFSSINQVFLVDGNRELKTKVQSLDEYAAPFLHRCVDGNCLIDTLRYEKNGSSVLELSIRAIKPSFYQGERYLFIEGEEYFYEIRVGFFDARGDFGNFLRQKTIDKIINSVTIKGK